MDLFQNAKELIDQSKNICILPSQEREESIINALALFYTLKELDKNVNLIIDEIPERLKFLIPSLDYISYPKNFVVAIPNTLAEISQIRYEKDEKDLKIYMTIDKGNIKKNDISFYFTEPKADLLITIGVKELNYPNQYNLLGNDVLSNVPVLNIDNQPENKNFGRVNLIKLENSLTELIFQFIKSINEKLIEKNIANALLTGIIISSDNFRGPKISSEILETAALLIKNGASRQQITDNLYKQKPLSQSKFLGQILNNLNTTEDNKVSWAILDSPNSPDFGEKEAIITIEQLKNNFGFQNLLVLWKEYNSKPVSKGFFYSENCDLIKKARDEYQGTIKNDNIFFLTDDRDPDLIKNNILKNFTQLNNSPADELPERYLTG